MAILQEDLVTLVDPPVWKGGRLLLLIAVAMLMLASHLHFDQQQTLSGRLLVPLALAIWLAGPIIGVARTSELRQRVLAEPNGFELFHAEVVRTKRRRWETLKGLGIFRYVNELAGTMAALILIPLFSAIILIAPRMFATRALPASVCAWFVAASVAVLVSVTIVAAGRRKAEASWRSIDTRAA